MDAMSREQIIQQLDAMRAQAAHLSEQVMMTRGAIQMLEHLLRLLDSAPASDDTEEAHDG